MILPEDITRIVSSQSDGAITRAQMERLDAWLAESPENVEAYKEFIAVGRAVKWRGGWDGINDRAAWRKISKVHGHNKRRRILERVSVAASIALLFGVGSWMMSHSGAPLHPAQPDWVPNEITLLTSTGAVVLSGDQALELRDGGTTINADSHTISYDTQTEVQEDIPVIYNTLMMPRGRQHTLRLSDGSTITLNSETKIRFPVLFSGDVREVFLEGEAFFDIKPNPDKPFVVHSEHASAEVLGTQFNFLAYSDDGNTSITLVEGSVKATGSDAKGQILMPGNQFNLNNATLVHSVREVDTNIYTSWTTGVFSFEAMPLEQLMCKLARWFDIEYEFRDESLRSNRYTGGISRDGDVQQVLRILGEVYDVSFKIKGNRIIISKK